MDQGSVPIGSQTGEAGSKTEVVQDAEAKQKEKYEQEKKTF